MKNKIFLLIATILIFCTFTPAYAGENNYEDAIESVIEYEIKKAKTTDLQEFVDDGLAPFAGESPVEWYVITLKKYDSSLDFSKYHRNLEKYLDNNKNLVATDYQRIALVKSVFSRDEDFIRKVIDEYTGTRGIMSTIFGLMISSYGEYECKMSSEDIADELLKYQAPDGGFGVGGKTDADVTAMALQALAPLKEKYQEEIRRSLDYLEKIRLKDGGYASYGIENTESLAQVILAYCALGEKKLATNLCNTLLKLQNSDGGFAHIKGRESDSMATYQSFMALIACDSLVKKKGFLYQADNNADYSHEESIIEKEEKSDFVLKGTHIKLIIIGTVLFVYLINLLFLIIRKKGKKAFFASSLIAAVGIVFFSFARIETKDEYYAKKISGNIETRIEIIGIDDKMNIPMKIIPINEGETVFTQLKNASILLKIPISYSGNEKLKNIYVRSIGELKEFDYGSASGWTYTVNGIYPDKSCTDVTLKKGDIVTWIYTDKGGGL